MKGEKKVADDSHLALQAIIDEFKTLSPETTSSFIFKKNGGIISSDQDTSKEAIKNLTDAFNELSKKAQVIEGLESLTIQGVEGQINVTGMSSLYLATVSSRAADPKIVKSLTQVIVPTMVKLIDQTAPAAKEKELPQTVKPIEKKDSPKVGKQEKKSAPKPKAMSVGSEMFLPRPPVNQFMVDRISGFLVASDTVRIDSNVVMKWRELYGDNEIGWVNVETLEGKTVVCRFKPIKDQRSNGKGIVQIPEKIMLRLQTGKGKLVIVKPVVEDAKEKKA